ncbi:MAG: hypothetical protein LBU88_08490 [Treponema sp.]|jgi:hypothetical protein|nr:hypothetical protein [Treponema sp.]
MPWRLIGVISIFIVFLVFIGFNLGDEYQCSINLGFKVLERVPVFYTIFVSFTLGFLCTLPVVLGAKKKSDISKKPKTKKDDPIAIAEEFSEPPPSYSGGKYFSKIKSNKKK